MNHFVHGQRPQMVILQNLTIMSLPMDSLDLFFQGKIFINIIIRSNLGNNICNEIYFLCKFYLSRLARLFENKIMKMSIF